MKTPSKYSKLLKEGKISKEMLCDCLFSVNKRAKNYRDKAREYGKYSKYAVMASCEKEKYYALKDEFLCVLKPKCIHREDGGPQKIRIYDYQSEYTKHLNKEDFVWENCYYDYVRDREVWFGDILDEKNHDYRYYLYYDLGIHSFHSPISESEIAKYGQLTVVNIGELDTYGEDTEILLSPQFVRKVLDLMYSGNFSFTFTEGLSGNLPVPPKG